MSNVKVLRYCTAYVWRKNLQQKNIIIIIIRGRWRVQVMTNRCCCVTDDKIRQLGCRWRGVSGQWARQDGHNKTRRGWDRHACWEESEYKRPNSLATSSTSLVWDLMLVGIAGSNPAISIEVCLLWVLWGGGLQVGLSTRSEECYRVWCVWVWSWRWGSSGPFGTFAPLGGIGIRKKP